MNIEKISSRIIESSTTIDAYLFLNVIEVEIFFSNLSGKTSTEISDLFYKSDIMRSRITDKIIRVLQSNGFDISKVNMALYNSKENKAFSILELKRSMLPEQARIIYNNNKGLFNGLFLRKYK